MHYWISKVKFIGNWDEELENVPFYPHTDYDLDQSSAVSIRSGNGQMHDLYKVDVLETPNLYKWTKLYYTMPKVRKIIDYFEVEKSRVRITKILPQCKILPHVDYNNSTVTKLEDYNFRILVPLNYSPDFIYLYKEQKLTLEKGDSIIFDPDLVQHGCLNNSNTIARYALIMICKPNNWFKQLLIGPQRTVTI